MKVALISRSTLYTVKGGDSIQLINTAMHLQQLGIAADIVLTHEPINYQQYDLLHFFNIIRPADMLHHIHKTNKPFVVSPILVNYHEYDQLHRGGVAGRLFRYLPAGAIEYLKTIARRAKGNDRLMHKSYLWKGHTRSVKEVLQRAAMILPNAALEYEHLRNQYGHAPPYRIVPNGIDPTLFRYDPAKPKEQHLVLCVARIEGIKNQLQLIDALNHSHFRVVIIGAPAPNQPAYYAACKKLAASNIHFLGPLPQSSLVQWYQRAAVHILPSWFETCGLSTLEAGVMNCNVVITDKGYTRSYFGDHATYCDPGSSASILQAVEIAASSENNGALRKKILEQYTWQQAAFQTAAAYREVLAK